MLELVLFEAGEVKLAIDQKCISHIKPMAADTGTSKTHDRKQTIVHEGKTMAVLNLSGSLNSESETSNSSDSKVIIVKGLPARALWADRVKGLVAVNDDQMADLPAVYKGAARACFSKVLRIEDQLALVVDTTGLFAIEHCATRSVSAQPIQRQQVDV